MFADGGTAFYLEKFLQKVVNRAIIAEVHSNAHYISWDVLSKVNQAKTNIGLKISVDNFDLMHEDVEATVGATPDRVFSERAYVQHQGSFESSAAPSFVSGSPAVADNKKDEIELLKDRMTKLEIGIGHILDALNIKNGNN